MFKKMKEVKCIAIVGGHIIEDKIVLSTPLPETYVYDLPVPANIMDPLNSRPGSTWSKTTEFVLQKNDEGEENYVQKELSTLFFM